MKETSNMIIVPENDRDIHIDKVLSEFNANAKMQTTAISKTSEQISEDGMSAEIYVYVEETEYKVNLSVVKLDIPPFFRKVHLFTDLDFQRIEAMTFGLSVEIEYNTRFLKSYHDQLKIVNVLLPQKLAVMDVPSEKMISGKWVKLAAESNIAPAPRYLYTVQAISCEGDEVWLHTHGLKRCGLTELEIICSNKEMYKIHYSVIENMANRMIEKESNIEAYDPMFLAWLTDTVAMVTTVVDWKEAVKYYPEAAMGGAESRDDYHSQDTSVIMLYKSKEDADNRKLSRIQEMDKYLGLNTMLMVSDAETNRMKKLARERIDYVRNAVKNNPEAHVLLKIGLYVDKEFLDPKSDKETQREHIWFELKEIKKEFFKEVFVCELTQEPYCVKKMHKGSIGKYTVDDITDWEIFANNNRYTTDDVYLLQ